MAFFSSAKNSGDTVTCIRVSVRVSGSTSVRAGASSTIEREYSFMFCRTVIDAATTAAGFETGTPVTTVLLGTTSTGRISAATCSAS